MKLEFTQSSALATGVSIASVGHRERSTVGRRSLGFPSFLFAALAVAIFRSLGRENVQGAMPPSSCR